MSAGRILLHLISVAGALLTFGPQNSVAQGTSDAVRQEANVAAVWAREELHWRYATAGDAVNYRTLWADGFRGWPCGEPHPTIKAKVTDWVNEIRDQKARLTYELTREGAADFGDVVVVFYQTPMVFEYPGGRVEGRGQILKITHTWRRFGETWLIVGGMCGTLDRAASP